MSKITRKIDSSWAQIKDSSRVNDTMVLFTPSLEQCSVKNVVMVKS